MPITAKAKTAGVAAAIGGAMLVLALGASAAGAADKVLNIYSHRQPFLIEPFIEAYKKETGTEVNIVYASKGLAQRLLAEGERSPADVILTVDIARLFVYADKDLLATVNSEVLNKNVPAHLRDPGNKWFAFSKRARIVAVSKRAKDAAGIQRYEDLADPKWKGRVCTRSGSNIYMLSLLAAKIAHDGEEAATEWAQGLWDNRARDPQGGDTDQLRAIVSGECEVVVANTYYFARALRTEVDGVSAHVDRIGWVFPDQDGNGAHMNVSAGAMAAHAPHPEAAKAFLEYLASDSAQEYFSNGNDEFPAVEGVALAPSAEQLGEFKPDELNLAELGRNQARAQMIYDSVGYE